MDFSTVWIFSSLCVFLGNVRIARLEEPSPPENPNKTATIPNEATAIPETKASTSRRNPIVKMWTVELAEVKEIEIVDYKQFKPSNDYVIQTEPITYYWIGKETPKGEVGQAASKAMIVAHKTNSKVKVQKEAQGKESPAFKALFQNGEVNESGSGAKSPQKKDVNAERMFVIEEEYSTNKDVLSLKEARISTYDVGRKRRTCLVFVFEISYIFCPNGFTAKQMKGAEALARIMNRRKGLSDEDFEIIAQNNTAFFNELIYRDLTPEVVMDPNEFTPAEMRQILDQTQIRKDGKEWFFLQVYNIHGRSDGTVKSKSLIKDSKFPLPDQFGEEHINLKQINESDCYIADSRSNAGLFVWIGKNSNIYVRKGAAKRTEILLKRSSMYDYATPVTFIDQDEVPGRINTMRELVEHLISQREGSGSN